MLPASVKFGHTFLLVDGIGNQDILEYLPDEEMFVKRQEVLETGRYAAGAVLVQDEVVDCV